MKLKQLLTGVKCEAFGNLELEISGLFHNSKEVKNNGLFFAIDGTKQKGSSYIEEAISKGAIVCVSTKKQESVTSVVVKDVREAMSIIASNFYGNPSEKMFVVGITGTNGKTTSSFMLESVFKQAGHKVGIIGTNGVFIDGKKHLTNFTTPDPILLQFYLNKMRRKGVDVVVMEVSAHALELQKIRGVTTDIALFTNLSQDHLDFFKNMQNYKRAKRSFFEEGYAKFAVVNVDDEFGKELAKNAVIPMLTFSAKITSKKNYKSDIIVANKKHNISSQSFEVITPQGCQKIKINLAGEFNISNALGVIATSLMAGINLSVIAKGLENLTEVEGRFNSYNLNGVRIIIDYAHTPDGLKNVLMATRKITKGKVISVFGCGGDRDALKRPIMGEISSMLADYTIVTNDNPRFERPEEIVKNIIDGIKLNRPYSIELNRKKAIILAISMASKGDSVIIAGKGCEDYMDVLGVKTVYSDKVVVEEIIEKFSK